MRTLVETGGLVGERGAYRRTRPLADLQVPATVQAVLAARIDRLPSEEKRLLQTAAVIGTEVFLPLLQAIAELPEDALHRGLTHLQAAEFLYETSLFPEREYTFRRWNKRLHQRRDGIRRSVVSLWGRRSYWLAAWKRHTPSASARWRSPAEAHYRQAFAMADELGMRPLQAHCHRGLGTLYATIGRRAEARAELSAAIALYRAMDMTFWLPQADEALAQVV